MWDAVKKFQKATNTLLPVLCLCLCLCFEALCTAVEPRERAVAMQDMAGFERLECGILPWMMPAEKVYSNHEYHM